jgi:hypothetical protein
MKAAYEKIKALAKSVKQVSLAAAVELGQDENKNTWSCFSKSVDPSR